MIEPTEQARNELSAEALAWLLDGATNGPPLFVPSLTADECRRIAALLRAGQRLYLTAEGCPHCCNDDGVDAWEAAHG